MDFPRDRAVPFSETWVQVDKASGVPLHAGTAFSQTIVCLLNASCSTAHSLYGME